MASNLTDSLPPALKDPDWFDDGLTSGKSLLSSDFESYDAIDALRKLKPCSCNANLAGFPYVFPND